MAMKRIGVLWKGKESQKAVLSGKLDLLGQDIGIGIFANTDENKKENAPDYFILRYSDMPREGGNNDQHEDRVPF